MTVISLDDDDLDEEDLAILAEVKKKGYYHGRPKSQACAAPAKIEPNPLLIASGGAPVKLSGAAAGAACTGRAQFDDFQRKWDRFDVEDYLDEVERDMTIKEAKKPDARMPATSSAPSKSLRPPPVAQFKVVLVGSGGVGKTAFVKNLLTGEFPLRCAPPSGANAQVLTQELRLHTNCGEISFSVREVGGQPGAGGHSVYAQGQAAIIMFAVTSRATYHAVPNWQKEVKTVLGTIPIVLVGNKDDVPAEQRQVNLKAKELRVHRAGYVQYFEKS